MRGACIAALGLAGAVLSAGCSDDDGTVNLGPSVTGSGTIVTVTPDVSGFSDVSLAYAFEATITRADSFHVEVRVDDNILEYLTVEKQGDVCMIYLESGVNYRETTQEANIVVPDLERMSLSGASTAAVSGFDSEHTMRASLSGASVTSGTMNTGDFILTLSGASRATLTGSCRDLLAVVSGASNLDFSDFTCEGADLEVSGASRVTVHPEGMLDCIVSGASVVYYYGDPVLGSIEISGESFVIAVD